MTKERSVRSPYKMNGISIMTSVTYAGLVSFLVFDLTILAVICDHVLPALVRDDLLNHGVVVLQTAAGALVLLQ